MAKIFGYFLKLSSSHERNNKFLTSFRVLFFVVVCLTSFSNPCPADSIQPKPNPSSPSHLFEWMVPQLSKNPKMSEALQGIAQKFEEFYSKSNPSIRDSDETSGRISILKKGSNYSLASLLMSRKIAGLISDLALMDSDEAQAIEKELEEKIPFAETVLKCFQKKQMNSPLVKTSEEKFHWLKTHRLAIPLNSERSFALWQVLFPEPLFTRNTQGVKSNRNLLSLLRELQTQIKEARLVIHLDQDQLIKQWIQNEVDAIWIYGDGEQELKIKTPFPFEPCPVEPQNLFSKSAHLPPAKWQIDLVRPKGKPTLNSSLFIKFWKTLRSEEQQILLFGTGFEPLKKQNKALAHKLSDPNWPKLQDLWIKVQTQVLKPSNQGFDLSQFFILFDQEANLIR